MRRIVKILSFLFLITSCSDQQPKPPLSGLLWGGEGNRLIIQSISNPTEVLDTLLISHLGEFSWQPNSFTSGFYRLSKTDGDGTILVLENEHPLYIDGQYFTFPNQTKITGGVSSTGFIRVDKFSEQWRKQLNETTSSIIPPNWEPKKEEIEKLHTYLDSIDAVYKTLIFQKEDHPLERMYALIQTSGKRHLFNIIKDSTLFLSTAKALTPYRKFPNVKTFLSKTDKLNKFVQQKELLRPGKKFPFHIIADTTILAQIEGVPVYLELYKPSDPINKSQWSLNENEVLHYSNSKIKICKIALDSIPDSKQLKAIIYYNPSKEEKTKLIENIPIHQLPTNFIIDKDGVIVASDIWNQQRREVLDRLLKK
ncbi:MAG TPA: hypothetical protein VKY45_10180 [Marinilabiliaceae bacterium]|nr:hypothetical protein [Marinilabiliaceae bacterium]